MFNVNEYVMYATTGVCQILDIKKEKLMGNGEEEYYVLHPVYQSSSTTIKIPVNNEKVMMRRLADQDEIDELIAGIPSVDITWIENDRLRSLKCKEALRSGSCKEWIELLEVLHSRKKDRTEQGKKFAIIDDNFMKLAEKLVYEEFSVSLQIPFENVEQYILKQLN